MGVKAEIKTENIEELKKLIDKANDQVDQLKKTLEEIESFRIQVSWEHIFLIVSIPNKTKRKGATPWTQIILNQIL